VTRWTRRLLFGAVAALVPALAGCEAGLNAPTQQYHPAANGATATQNGISVNNAFVLGPELNSTLQPGDQAGVFLALSAQNGDKLVSVAAPGTAASVKLPGGSVNVGPLSPVALEGPQPAIVLTNLQVPLSGGQTVQLVLNFANAGLVTIQVPVEPHAYEYATYSSPAPAPTATTTPKSPHSSSPAPTASGSHAGQPATGQPGASPSPSP
jgi:copper(I)-binding protein